jgi:hypothetical protein
MATPLKSTDIDDGSMSQKERQNVVDKIKTDKDTRIILMSFKAGGVGKSQHYGRWSEGA